MYILIFDTIWVFFFSQGAVIGVVEARDGDAEAKPPRKLTFTLLNGMYFVCGFVHRVMIYSIFCGFVLDTS